MNRLVPGFLLAVPAISFAHGFAQRYDLPVPLGLYITGAALVVALSFAIIAFFVRGHRTVEHYPRWNLHSSRAFGWIASPWLATTLQILSVGWLTLIVIAGFWGNENPYQNIAPTSVWVIWWVGLAYVSGLIGNLWVVLNPWNAVFRLLERTWPGGRPGLNLTWPRWLGQWPAVVLFTGFVWAELVWPHSDKPRSLACAVLAYTAITLAGMFLFGRHRWLRGGEAFSVVFTYLARFSPTEIRAANSAICKSCGDPDCGAGCEDCVNCLHCFERTSPAERQLNVRPWAVGLLTLKPLPIPAVAFVLVMLASVTFDGLLATPLWAGLAEWMLYSEWLRPLILALQEPTGNAIAAISTIALVVFLLGFFGLYAIFSALMWIATPSSARSGISIAQVAGLFVLSLVPIALAYHLAHYLSFLLIVGQYMIPLASDPLGLGWNLFGTRLYMVDIGIVNARFVWITSVIAIVTGHIVAVWLGHVMALRVFRSNRAALLSQIPMLILMVAYTMLSLWILAQPVVETG